MIAVINPRTHSVPQPKSPRRLANLTVRQARLAAVAAGLAASLTLAGCAGSPRSTSGSPVADLSTSTSSIFDGDLLPQPYAKPPLTLTSTSGTAYDLDTATAGRLTLVYFGYTHCPDVCPTTMATLAAALRALSPAQRAKITVVFVTTDPNRDTPSVLRAWLRQYDPSFIGLTGAFTTIQRAAADLGITIEPPVKQPGGGYTVTHGAEVIAFNTDNKARVLWTAGTTVAQYDHDLPLLLAGRDMRPA